MALAPKLADRAAATQLSGTLAQMKGAMDKLQTRINEQDKEHQQVRGLFNIGRAINSTLDLEVLLSLVIEMIISVTGAERAFLMLSDHASGQLVMKVARGLDEDAAAHEDFQISRSIADRVAREHMPVLTTNAQEDARFKASQSIINFSLRSILCVPLRVKDKTIGVIYADNRVKTSIFSAHDRDLLAAFADQAAIAIENARLFEELRRNIAEVSALKGFQDSIFASIASGVITLDMQDHITTFNRAAEQILNVQSVEVAARPLGEALQVLGSELSRLVQDVKQTHEPLIAYEMRRQVPQRGAVSLSMSLSNLRDATAQTELGVAIVMDDVTEKKRLQARQEMFGRYLAPSVIERLPDDPSELRLGGTRQTISILFADVRGYSTYSASVTPEALVDILNQYLSLSAQAILAEEGTLDKFMGDAVVAFWNAPEGQADHPMRAVRAAWRMHEAILQHQASVPPAARLQFGVGVHTGDAVVGNIGAERALNYTAIGDAVNLARRLQEGAAGNQIVLSEGLYQLVGPQVKVVELEAVHVKGRSALEKRWELRGLAPEPSEAPGLPR